MTAAVMTPKKNNDAPSDHCFGKYSFANKQIQKSSMKSVVDAQRFGLQILPYTFFSTL